MATLKDVAHLACIDVGTVSRTLNNTSYVHPDMEARVLTTVKELGYQPMFWHRDCGRESVYISAKIP